MIRTLLDFIFCYEPGCWRLRPQYEECCKKHQGAFDNIYELDAAKKAATGLGVEIADDLEAITLRPQPALRFDPLERKRKRDRKRLDL